MADMLSYSVEMLGAVADFMMTPPVSYLVGFIMLSCAVSIIMLIIRPR